MSKFCYCPTYQCQIYLCEASASQAKCIGFTIDQGFNKGGKAPFRNSCVPVQ